MTIAPTAAANAYAIASQIADPVAKGAGSPVEGGFGDMIADVVRSFAESGAKADQAAVAASVGQANIVDVVTAVAETELALETLVSVRDRVVGAYEEIMRMPI